MSHAWFKRNKILNSCRAAEIVNGLVCMGKFYAWYYISLCFCGNLVCKVKFILPRFVCFLLLKRSQGAFLVETWNAGMDNKPSDSPAIGPIANVLHWTEISLQPKILILRKQGCPFEGQAIIRCPWCDLECKKAWKPRKRFRFQKEENYRSELSIALGVSKRNWHQMKDCVACCPGVITAVLLLMVTRVSIRVAVCGGVAGTWLLYH